MFGNKQKVMAKETNREHGLYFFCFMIIIFGKCLSYGLLVQMADSYRQKGVISTPWLWKAICSSAA